MLMSAFGSSPPPKDSPNMSETAKTRTSATEAPQIQADWYYKGGS